MLPIELILDVLASAIRLICDVTCFELDLLQTSYNETLFVLFYFWLKLVIRHSHSSLAAICV